MKLTVSCIVWFMFAAYCIPVIAGPGDTIKVQTFTYNWPKRPGNGEREGRFLFPDRSKKFQKILMYYSLKCDPSQSPACGEWDYLTYTYLYEHTGRLDSTLLTHANFQADNKNQDTLQYMLTPSWEYLPGFERNITRLDTTSLRSFTVGTATTSMTFPCSRSAPDGRAQFLWNAAELKSAGLAAGSITGLRLQVSSGGGTLKNFTIRFAPVPDMSFKAGPVTPIIGGATTVYRKTTAFASAGSKSIQFTTPFDWDGTSSILMDVSYESNTGADAVVDADTAPPMTAIESSGDDRTLDFAPVDFVDVPVSPFASIDTAITISLWQYGDPAVQPAAGSIFTAADEKNQRVLNAHLPWSNGQVYWDAGNAGTSFDRINKTAQADEFRGNWNHWAFTKSSNTGIMNIYRNGVLWHTGTGLTRTMSGITSFKIGSNPAGTANHYDGMIDDVCVWDRVLDRETIARWMHTTPDATHPEKDHLVASYRFDEGGGTQTADAAMGGDAPLIGRPEWRSFAGDRVKNFVARAGTRPVVTFEQGVFTSRVDSVFVLDSVPKHQVMIVMYSDTLHPNIPTDTLYRWPVYDRFTFDRQGRMLDSTRMPADSMLIRKDYGYYGPPFEVVNRFELGRFITPYGINLSLGEGWTWVYDVTDFRPLLADSVHLVSGNWQELHDLKFMMIEGEPERDVVSIQNMWVGNVPLNNFENRVPPRTVELDSNATMFKLRVTTTGHQFSNATNCAEFCPKIHSLDIDGTTRYFWQILQECALNPLYPQGGTWIYDRAGWCPGMPATTQHLELTPYVTGKTVTLDYNSQPDPYGNYIVETQLVSYSSLRRRIDASLEEIIAPNSFEQYRRSNPCCGKPKITIRNLGSERLQSVDITYGPVGGNTASYRWSGNLAFGEQQAIELPAFAWGSWSQENVFAVTLTNPNGGTDENPTNDGQLVHFVPADSYPTPLIVTVRTNNAGFESSYQLLDPNGVSLLARGPLTSNTTYRDTLAFPPGCYEFILFDAGDDGLSFFANSDGNGYLRFSRLAGTLYLTPNPDFGKEVRYQFRYDTPSAVDHPIPENSSLQLYPNPAVHRVTADFRIATAEDVSFEIHDMLGRVVMEVPSRQYGPGSHQSSIDLAAFQPGSYLLVQRTGGGTRKIRWFSVVR